MNPNLKQQNEQLANALQQQNIIASEKIVKLLQKCNQEGHDLKQTLIDHGLVPATLLQKLSSPSDKTKPKAATNGNNQSLIASQVLNSQNFGSYKIDKEIARGGMGVVYKARQRGFDRAVALKVMLSTMADEEGMKRFEREAIATSRLQHPNIVKLYQYGREGSYPYFTMQYIDGGTFDDILDDSTMSLEQKLAIFQLICRGVGYAHSNKVVHRDLKPSNILMDQNQIPYITDFGLAKLTDHKSIMTQTGCILGTAFYMSPEQIAGKRRQIGSASDIFSLGVILYQVLTGNLPFHAETFPELCQKISSADYAMPREHDSSIAKGIQAICLKSMATKPEDRYTTAEDLAQDIQNFLSGKRVSAMSFQWRKSLEILYRRHQKKWIAAIVLLAFCIALLVFSSSEKSLNKDNLATYYQQFDQFLDLRQLDKAEKIIQEITFVFPNEAEAIWRQSLLWEKRDNWFQVRLCWKKLTQTSNHKILNQLVTKALAKDFYEEATLALKTLYDQTQETPYLEKLLRAWKDQGQYANIWKYLKQDLPQSHILDLVLMEMHIQRGNLDDAKIQSQKLQANFGNLDFETQSRYLLYKIILGWQDNADSLNRYQWLNQNMKLPSELSRLKSTWQNLSTRKGELQGRSYLANFYRELLLYEKLWQLELATNHSDIIHEVQTLLHDIRNEDGYKKILFHHTILRALIRHQKWHELIDIATKACEQFPWVANFYHLKGLALFFLEDLTAGFKEIKNAIQLAPRVSHPGINFSFFMFKRLTQEEFELCNELLNPKVYTIEAYQKFYRQFFRQEQQEVFFQSQAHLSRKSNTSTDWQKLLGIALKTKTVAVQNLVIEQLLAHSEETPFLEAVQQIKPSSQPFVERLEKRLDDQKKELIEQEMRRRITQYISLPSPENITKIKEGLSNGKVILRGVIQNPKEKMLIRLAAMRLVITLATENDDLDFIQKLNNEGSIQEKILVRAAMNEIRAFPFHLNSEEWQSSTSLNYSFQKLIALNISGSLEHSQVQELLSKRDEVITCAIIFNQVDYFHSKTKDPDALVQLLLPITKSENLHNRALSYSTIWFVYHNLFKTDGHHAFPNFWKKYGYTINLALEDPSQEVNMTMLQTIIHLWKGFEKMPRSDEPQMKKLLNNFRSLMDHPLYTVRSLTARATGLAGENLLWEIVNNPRPHSFIRIQAISGCFRQPQDKLVKSISKILKMVKKPSVSESDRELKQVILSIIGIFRNDVGPTYISALKVLLNFTRKKFDEDPGLDLRLPKWNSLLWFGEKKDIRKLWQQLQQEENIYHRKAIATSLSGLVLKFYPNKLPALLNELRKQPLPVRRGAAWGLRETVRQLMWTERFRTDHIPAYNFYLNTLVQASDPTIKKQIIAAHHAILEIFPSLNDYLNLAYIYYKNKKYKLASDLLNKAFQQKHYEMPNSIPKSYTTSRILLIKGLINKDNQARYISFIEKSAKVYPQNAESYSLLSKAYSNSKKHNKSNFALWKQHFLSSNAKSFLSLVDGYKRRGDIEQAKTILRSFCKMGYYPLSHKYFRKSIVIKHYPFVQGEQWVQDLPN